MLTFVTLSRVFPCLRFRTTEKKIMLEIMDHQIRMSPYWALTTTNPSTNTREMSSQVKLMLTPLFGTRWFKLAILFRRLHGRKRMPERGLLRIKSSSRVKLARCPTDIERRTPTTNQHRVWIIFISVGHETRKRRIETHSRLSSKYEFWKNSNPSDLLN